VNLGLTSWLYLSLRFAELSKGQISFNLTTRLQLRRPLTELLLYILWQDRQNPQVVRN
jgi:hypothetical protein